jgi:hypothetical protein
MAPINYLPTEITVSPVVGKKVLFVNQLILKLPTQLLLSPLDLLI